MTTKTTARSLNDRAAAYVATLDDDDPVRVANQLLDLAIDLQDAGRWDEAEQAIARADSLLAAA